MRRLRALAAGALALAARAAAADPLPETGFGIPRDASLDGHHVDDLIHFTLLAIAVIFAVALAMLIWSFARDRARPAWYTHGNARTVGAVVGAIAVIAVGVDGTLLVRTLLDLHERLWNFQGAEAQPGAIRIEVNAHQWAWTARYPSADGKFGTPDDVVTLDDIRVPVGVPVVVQLASTDVIHSLYLPNFRVKQDAVPGMINRLTFQAVKPGEYEIGCAQHCGPNHYKMRGVLTVLPPDEYRAWLDTMQTDAQHGYDPDNADAHWGWEWRRD